MALVVVLNYLSQCSRGGWGDSSNCVGYLVTGRDSTTRLKNYEGGSVNIAPPEWDWNLWLGEGGGQTVFCGCLVKGDWGRMDEDGINEKLVVGFGHMLDLGKGLICS